MDSAATSVVDFSVLKKQHALPPQFSWPRDKSEEAEQALNEPLVDLEGFFRGDEEATQRAAMLLKEACVRHGFFQVTNHGVDPQLIEVAHEQAGQLFSLPLDTKRSTKKPGVMWGFSIAHSDRFGTTLPWKETFSFPFYPSHSNSIALDYITSTLGTDFSAAGRVYQRYCQAMHSLSLAILELLAISLGVERRHFRDFYEDGRSIMRCNYYPPCRDPWQVLGTGPHYDPTSITILSQDQVEGLQVFANNKWHTVSPRQGALVVNIGDTFMAMSNGIYQSCLHRAVVNDDKDRLSLAFFLNPRHDKVVKPPQNLVGTDGTRKYPDFTWSDFLEFTQKHYRANDATFQNFANWILSSKSLE